MLRGGATAEAWRLSIRAGKLFMFNFGEGQHKNASTYRGPMLFLGPVWASSPTTSFGNKELARWSPRLFGYCRGKQSGID